MTIDFTKFPAPWKACRWYEPEGKTAEYVEPGDDIPPVNRVCAANGRNVTCSHDLFQIDPDNADAIANIPAMLEALRRAHPLLIRLGDFTGNADGRCEVVLSIRTILESAGVKP